MSDLVFDEVDLFLSCLEPGSGNFSEALLSGIFGDMFLESLRRLLIRYLDCPEVGASEGYSWKNQCGKNSVSMCDPRNVDKNCVKQLNIESSRKQAAH